MIIAAILSHQLLMLTGPALGKESNIVDMGHKAASSIISTRPDPDDSTEIPLEGECPD